MPEKVHRCVNHLKADGKSEESAWAICNDSIESEAVAVSGDLNAVDVGAKRHDLRSKGIPEKELDRIDAVPSEIIAVPDWPPKITGEDKQAEIILNVPDTGYPPDKPFEPYLSEPTLQYAEWNEEDHPRDEEGKFTSLGSTPEISNSNNKMSTKLSEELKSNNVSPDLKEKILNPFSRTTDPNSSFGYTDIQNAWDQSIQKNPEMATVKQDLIQYEKDVNDSIQQTFEKTDSLWRGMRGNELDSIAERGLAEPYQYSFISFTMDKEAGMGYGKNASDIDGITVEFDKNAIKNQKMWNGADMKIQPVQYSAFYDHAGLSEEIDGQYPISYADEMEVRSWGFATKDTIKSITIHKNEFMTNEETDQLYQKYSKLFPNITISVNDPTKKTKEAKQDGAASATATPEGDSTPSLHGLEGFASSLEIPPDFGVNTQNEHLEFPFLWDISDDGTLTEDVDEEKKRKSWMKKLGPWLALIGSGLALEEILAQPKLEIQARYVYTGHEYPEICQSFHGKIYNLLEKTNRPVPPSEALGFTNTHPNCKCYWEMVTVPTKTDKSTKTQKDHIKHINSIVGQKARAGTLHTVKPDGSLSPKTRRTNPRNEAYTIDYNRIIETHVIREAVMDLRQEFKWMTQKYESAIRNLPVKGKWYIIRASTSTITDHRTEGEPYRRLLSNDELHALTRTAIGKEMDVNHDPAYKTQAHIYDAEFDKLRGESQMLVLEQDPEIINAIANGTITAVSINGGSPRSERVECGVDECFVVPEGVVLGELDNIALTWVVTAPSGFYYKGVHIPPATPGVKNTIIEEF